MLPRLRVLPVPHPAGSPGTGLPETGAGPTGSTSAESLCLGASFFPLFFFFLRRRSDHRFRPLVSHITTLVAAKEGVSGKQEWVAGGKKGQELFLQQQLKLLVVEEEGFAGGRPRHS